MANNLFVGGLPYEIKQDDLAKLFESCGTVVSAKLIMDRETGRSKGFGFVEMSSDAEAKAAVAKINGTMLGGRTVFVNEARPQEPREPREGGPESKPGFVERRSGKDRRQGWGPVSAGGRDFVEKKPWADKKPFGDRKPYGDKKPWGEKKPWGDKKPFGEKKPWEEKKSFGDKKPWGEKKPWGDKKPFGDKKPWEEKKSFGDKKPFGERKPYGDKKPWGEKKAWGDKPAFGDKKPWADKKKPWEAMKSKPGEGGGKKKWGAGGPEAGKKYTPKRKKFGSGIFGKSRRPGS